MFVFEADILFTQIRKREKKEETDVCIEREVSVILSSIEENIRLSHTQLLRCVMKSA